MLNIQKAARVVAGCAAVASAALTVVLLEASTELGSLRAATTVALSIGCLAVAVGVVRGRRHGASAMGVVGLMVCLSLSAMSTDTALSGSSGRPVAVVTGILAFAALMLTVVAHASAGE